MFSWSMLTRAPNAGRSRNATDVTWTAAHPRGIQLPLNIRNLNLPGRANHVRRKGKTAEPVGGNTGNIHPEPSQLGPKAVLSGTKFYLDKHHDALWRCLYVPDAFTVPDPNCNVAAVNVLRISAPSASPACTRISRTLPFRKIAWDMSSAKLT